MKHKILLLTLTIVAVMVIARISLADQAGEHDLDMSDPAGSMTLTEPILSSVGEFSAVPGSVGLEPDVQPPSMLARRDYMNVYQHAKELLDRGVQFRTTEISVVPANTITNALQNYQDFNGGQVFYAFCSNYNVVDVQGYCQPLDESGNPRENVRNKLIRARELFGFLALADPVDTTIPLNGQDVKVRDLGREGVLEATREIANVHLIFGNEFLVDALDYRFSAGALPNADQIIQTEIDQLNSALQQYTFAVDVLAYAFNADFGGPSGVHIGDYFTNREFELFGITSERMVMTMDEIANRYRQIGRSDLALAIYARGSSAQYLQALALAQKATERDADFLNNGGWAMMTNLGRMKAMAQAIHDGLNSFGFTDKYVPLMTYGELFNLTQNQFLRDASEDEVAARNAQRDFDMNATSLRGELQNLRLTYDNQLIELCGNGAPDLPNV